MCYLREICALKIDVVFLFQVKPLIWIESVIEKHSHSRIEYMIKVGSFSVGTFICPRHV